jgi:acid stress-induced BolA-like protein IbaG/YrbA
MPTAEDVKARIEASIPGSTADVQSQDDVHFSARVVAEAFAGLSRLE